MMPSVADIAALFQVLLIDISLAGDNAIIVGMAAAGLPQVQRHKAVWAGIAAATVLRIIFAIFAVELLKVVGLLAAGGILLLWVSWKMYRDLRHMHKVHHEATPEEKAAHAKEPPKKLSDAIVQIIIADVSMSLDNVLAVAGVAREHMTMLVIGLVVSVGLMGAASASVAKLVARWPWIGYVGLAVVFYTSLHMMWDGTHELLAYRSAQ